MKDVWLAFLFLCYQIFVWGGSGYIVFIQDRSGWWFLLSLFVSALGILPLRLEVEKISKSNMFSLRETRR